MWGSATIEAKLQHPTTFITVLKNPLEYVFKDQQGGVWRQIITSGSAVDFSDIFLLLLNKMDCITLQTYSDCLEKQLTITY